MNTIGKKKERKKEKETLTLTCLDTMMLPASSVTL
jgi:hypothetical protein